MGKYWIAAFAGLAVFGTCVEMIYEAELESSSADVIQFLQFADSSFVVLIFEVLEVVTARGFVAAAFLIYLFGNRFPGAFAALLGVLGATLASLLKMCFQHPRPLYTFSHLKAISCSRDSGFPSGHAFSSGAVCFFLLFYWTRNSKKLVQKTLFLASLLMVVAVDRLYMAAHFYFQILMGFVYSLLLVSIVVHEPILNWFRRSFMLKNSQASLHLAGLGLWGVCLLVYFFREGEIKLHWNKNFADKCGKELVYEEFLYKNIHECTAIGFLMGFPLGYCLSSKVQTVEFSKEAVGLALGIGGVFGGVYFLSETTSKYFLPSALRLLMSFINRYLVGLAVSYFIPVALQKFIKQPEILSFSNTNLVELNKL